MTDINKYRNVSLSHETHEKIINQSKKLCSVKLSAAQTVRVAINLVDECLKDRLIPSTEDNVKHSVKIDSFKKIKEKLDKVFAATIFTRN